MVCHKEAQREAHKKALVVKNDDQNVRLHHGIKKQQRTSEPRSIRENARNDPRIITQIHPFFSQFEQNIPAS